MCIQVNPVIEILKPQQRKIFLPIVPCKKSDNLIQDSKEHLTPTL